MVRVPETQTLVAIRPVHASGKDEGECGVRLIPTSPNLTNVSFQGMPHGLQVGRVHDSAPGRRDGEGSLETCLWISLASLHSGLRFVSRQDAEQISKEQLQARPPVTAPWGTYPSGQRVLCTVSSSPCDAPFTFQCQHAANRSGLHAIQPDLDDRVAFCLSTCYLHSVLGRPWNSPASTYVVRHCRLVDNKKGVQVASGNG